jgi:non-lysosomal glucosylceramidase
MKVSYNEQDNVTCTGCGWHVGGKWNYLWKKNASAPPPGPPAPTPACKTKIIGHNLDVSGHDLGSHVVATGELCAAACCANQDCAGALFEPTSDVNFDDCKKGQPCCFMKTSVLSTKPHTVAGGSTLYAAVGHSSDTPVDNVVPPPMGLRSSPALGGVGAGSTELRSDGSFRDWTILNQGPAGSGKYGIVDDVWMAARVGGKAKVLRTHPPSSLAADGVDALTFSGSYPLTRLVVEDESLTTGAAEAAGLETRVFGYSTLKPTNLAESAYPALVLTLEVANRGTSPTTADFMFTLPFGAWTDCSRKSASNNTVSSKTTSHVACMHSCTDGCASWQFTDGVCVRNPDVPLTAHAVGSYCGVKGSGWVLSEDKKAVTWTQKPNPVGPSMGSITLRPSASGSDSTVSFGAADDPASLFQEFAASGHFSTATSPTGAVAASGAASVSASVGAGETTTLSIVFAWYFPDRDYKANSDHTVDGIILGNMYQNLWGGSEEVASALATEERLTSIIRDINAHHQVVAHVDNPTPVWLKDMLLNQFSHYHMFMWYKDGRMREYEAWSCDDVDRSVTSTHTSTHPQAPSLT